MESINAAAAYATYQAGSKVQQAVQISVVKKANEMQAQVLQLLEGIAGNNLQPEGVGRILDSYA